MLLIPMSVYGNLPTEGQLAEWEFAVQQHSAVPQGLLVWLSFFFFCTNVLTESANTIYFSILGLVIHIYMFLILTTIPY